jgi:Cu/Ag efflux protein CusF
MSKKAVLFSVGLGLALALSTATFAQEERPSEGQITKIDPDAGVITVRDEVGDEWDLYWSESTKADGTATLLELRPGDFVQFGYEEREGRKVLLEIRRSSKAKWLKLVGDVSRLV